MTHFKDIVIGWLKNGAIRDEIADIYLICSGLLIVDEKKLIDDCIGCYNQTDSGLSLIKLIKDRTGWSLRQSKDFYDDKVLPLLK